MTTNQLTNSKNKHKYMQFFKYNSIFKESLQEGGNNESIKFI